MPDVRSSPVTGRRQFLGANTFQNDPTWWARLQNLHVHGEARERCTPDSRPEAERCRNDVPFGSMHPDVVDREDPSAQFPTIPSLTERNDWTQIAIYILVPGLCTTVELTSLLARLWAAFRCCRCSRMTVRPLVGRQHHQRRSIDTVLEECGQTRPMLTLFIAHNSSS